MGRTHRATLRWGIQTNRAFIKELTQSIWYWDQNPDVQKDFPPGTIEAVEARLRMHKHLLRIRSRPTCAWLDRVTSETHRVWTRRARARTESSEAR